MDSTSRTCQYVVRSSQTALTWRVRDRDVNPGSEDELRQVYEAVGRAEAEMFIRNLDVANGNWGYEVLSLVCSNGPELEVLIGQIFAWSDVAGSKLKEKVELETAVRSYMRTLGGDYSKRHTVEGTLMEN